MSRRLNQAVQLLFHVEDTPHRVALAFGIGVWIAFFPILGMHTGLALAIAIVFRLSRSAILIGAYINNPWTLAPLYTAGTVLGCLLMGVSTEGLRRFDWNLSHGAFFRTLLESLQPYLMPFLLGNTMLGVICGAISYVLLRSFLERRKNQ